MKIKDLIEILEDLPRDGDVYFEFEDHGVVEISGAFIDEDGLLLF